MLSSTVHRVLASTFHLGVIYVISAFRKSSFGEKSSNLVRKSSLHSTCQEIGGWGGGSAQFGHFILRSMTVKSIAADLAVVLEPYLGSKRSPTPSISEGICL